LLVKRQKAQTASLLPFCLCLVKEKNSFIIRPAVNSVI
jgi:hypothetical protein